MKKLKVIIPLVLVLALALTGGGWFLKNYMYDNEHFLTTQKDVDDILTSSEKLKRRGARIEALELETAGTSPDTKPEPKSFDNRMGQLKLRVVDED